MLMVLMLLQYADAQLTSYYAHTTATSHVRNRFDFDELQELAADCREARAAAPRHPWPVLASASAAISAWEFDEAVRLLDAMTLPPRGQFAPPCPVAAARYTLRGAALQCGRHPAEALMAYREAVSCDGSFAPARLALGWALLDSGDHAGALPQFEAILTARPTDAVALAGRGAARYLRSREPVGAHSVVRIAATDYAPFGQADREAARLDLDCAIALGVGHPVAHEFRAQLRYHGGDFAGAEADYLAALKFGPSPSALTGVAVARLAGGDAEGAGRAANLGLLLTADVRARGYLHMVRGEVAKLGGDAAGHRAALDRALEECSTDPELASRCRAALGR